MSDFGTRIDSVSWLPTADLKSPYNATDCEQHYKDWPNAAGFNALGDIRSKVDLPVSGEFPSYVAGALYRTGPGGYKVPRSDSKDGFMSCSHWFDGFSTTHKFDLSPRQDGACDVSYTSYCHVDELIERARTTGTLDGITFGQKRDPCDTLYKKLKTVFTPFLSKTLGTVNSGVVIRDGLPSEITRAGLESKDSSSLLALTTDATTSKFIDADTLEPLGVTSQNHLHPSLKGTLSAAHAARDPVTGEVFNYNLAFGAKDVYRVFRADPATGKVDILAELSGPDFKPAYIHSMFLTENFVVLSIWPAFFADHGFKMLWERNLMNAMLPFNSSAKTTWCVIDRHHGRGLVKKFQSPAFFSFHSTNAFETSNGEGEVDITRELVTFENLDILHHFYYDNLVSTGPHVADFLKSHPNMDATLARYKLSSIPLTAPTTATSNKTSHPAELILSIPTPRAGDLPSINANYALRPHRYVWSVLSRGKSSFVDGLGKTDTQTGECAVWEHAKHTPGEPIFVPRPGAEAEDDGVVLSVVFDGVSGSSYLICLDAATMVEVARAEVGTAVGFGFHGRHIGVKMQV